MNDTAAVTLFPDTVAGSIIKQISHSRDILNTSVFDHFSGCPTAALLTTDLRQAASFSRPPASISNNINYFRLQYPNIQSPAITLGNFHDNTLKYPTNSAITSSSTGSNKRKSSNTNCESNSNYKTYSSSRYYNTCSETLLATPSNKKTCLKFNGNRFFEILPEIQQRSCNTLTATCMAASPVRPIIGQQESSQQLITSAAASINGNIRYLNSSKRHHPSAYQEFLQINNLQESVHNRQQQQQHSSMDQSRKSQQAQSQTSQSQYQRDPQMTSNLLVLGNGSTATGVTPISTSALDIAACTQQQPNSVLRVIIENMLYPVTLDVLHQIFSRYGKVLRIITFNKNNTFQALVQLSEASCAQLARQSLDGQNVYNGCCCLRIDYSKLATLNVKYNNDKSRDYTNPNLPSGELTLEQQLSLVSAATGGQIGPTIASLVQSPFAFQFGTNPQYPFQQQATAFPQADALASPSGISPFLTGLTTTLASGATSPVTANAAMINATTAALRFPHVGVLNISSVVLVSNLDENVKKHQTHADYLCPIFRRLRQMLSSLFSNFLGVYGDVHRVKILYNKKDNALIQYAEPQQAQLAIQHLDKVRWHDKNIRVATSRHSTVQMPKEGQPDAGLTRDYSQSSLHRFKKPGSKNYLNIYPPSSTLHLSNIPPNITEEFLTNAFEQRGYLPKGFKFFPKDHKMALLQLNDVETAINALIEMHNLKLAENAHLRVSFSKSGI
ncbi:unnamed protein product [Thelazia callipaeda]|uniref:RRM domain-containing protein n=1 Tax=Thelazia callipaeda TaxID=103827 RepID=A0A158RCJ4_THECL|nr:unnamed protein product [Thelazia callipaeda]